jgi:transcriptional regulator with XRE-family HTH domain
MSTTKFTHPDKVFRALIKQLRVSQQLTQKQLAERLGRPQSYVSKYELGERRLDFVETFLVCEALDSNVENFSAEFLSRVSRRRTKGR